MGRKPGRTYVEKDFKKNTLILVVALLITVVIIALISIWPTQAPRLGDVSKNGVARSFLFPFVYTDGDNSLYVLREDRVITAIDDSVSYSVHDFLKEKVYYLRDHVLYEYNISSDSRKILVAGFVDSFKVLDDRSTIIYATLNGDLYLYDCANKTGKAIGKNEISDLSVLSVTGKSHLLYIDGFDKDGATADLYCADNDGETRLISDGITVSTQDRTFSISPDDKYITYIKENVLYILDFDGRELAAVENGSLIEEQPQNVLIDSGTKLSYCNEGVPVDYILQEGENASVLSYFTGKGLKTISENVGKIIGYTESSDRLFFTVSSEDDSKQIDVMMSVDGKEPVKAVSASNNAEFVWNENSGRLYLLDDNVLYRIHVFDDFKIKEVASGVYGLQVYLGKPFVVYTDVMGNDYYVLSENSVEQAGVGVKRLYGLDSSKYLLASVYSGDKLSLDYVDGESMRRINSNVLAVLAFDKNIENVLYLTADGLMLKSGDETVNLGNVSAVVPTEMIN